MSFSIDELEQACKDYESKFCNGQECPGVRTMLVNMIQGGRSIPKRKKHTMPKYTKRIKLEEVKVTPRPVEELKVVMTQDLQGGEVSKEEVEMEVPPDTPNYIELVMKLNNQDHRRDQYMKRRFLQYRLMHTFGLVNYKERKVKKPMSPMIWDLTVWRWVVEDYASAFVEERGVTILKGGMDVDFGGMQLNFEQVVDFIMQVRSIIKSNPFLEAMEFPMMEALEQKVFVSYLLANI